MLRALLVGFVLVIVILYILLGFDIIYFHLENVLKVLDQVGEMLGLGPVADREPVNFAKDIVRTLIVLFPIAVLGAMVVHAIHTRTR